MHLVKYFRYVDPNFFNILLFRVYNLKDNIQQDFQRNFFVLLHNFFEKLFEKRRSDF